MQDYSNTSGKKATKDPHASTTHLQKKEQNLTVNSAAATPKGFEITVCDLTLNSGQVYDISNEVQDIKIHESLYQSAFRVEIYIFDLTTILF